MDEEIDECTCLSDTGLGAPVPCTVHNAGARQYRVLVAQRPGSMERCWAVWDENRNEVVRWTTSQRSAWMLAHRLAACVAVADDIDRIRASNARLLEALAILGVEYVTDDEVIGPYWLPAPEGQCVAGDAVEAATARRARIVFDGEAEKTRATLLATVERHRAKRHPLGERHGRAVEAVLRWCREHPGEAAESVRVAIEEATGADPCDELTRMWEDEYAPKRGHGSSPRYPRRP